MNKYSITLSKTSDGQQEYLQIVSDELLSVNIVLFGEFKLRDARKKTETKHEYRGSLDPTCCSCGWICGADNSIECRQLWEKHAGVTQTKSSH